MSDSLYDRVGGQEWFDALVGRFYAGVESDPVLRPLYPAELGESKVHLALFLAQYFGGPPRYNAIRGLPRLRMRHAPFSIGGAEHDAWLIHMTAAVRGGNLVPEDEVAVIRYFTSAAAMLRNEEPSASGRAGLKLLPPG
ncbi:MAG: globin [Acidimicrobiales bacterium]|jgi:hemoglobin